MPYCWNVVGVLLYFVIYLGHTMVDCIVHPVKRSDYLKISFLGGLLLIGWLTSIELPK